MPLRIAEQALIRMRAEEPELHARVLAVATFRDGHAHVDNLSLLGIASGRPPSRGAIASGTGTELKALLSRVGIKASPTCSCNKRAKTMDEKGISWCEENVETICDWLQEEATKRKLPFVRLAGKALIHMAIRRAKKGTNK
jgi:hypothetical protein